MVPRGTRPLAGGVASSWVSRRQGGMGPPRKGLCGRNERVEDVEPSGSLRSGLLSQASIAEDNLRRPHRDNGRKRPCAYGKSALRTLGDNAHQGNSTSHE